MAYLPVLAAGTAIASMLGNTGKKEDIDRLSSRLDSCQQDQMKYNFNMAEKVSGQGEQLKNLESSNGRLSSRTDRLSDLLGEASLQLGRVQSDASNLRMDQDRFGTRLDLMQSEQGTFNTEIARRGARVEESHRLFSEQQLAFNSNITSETAGLRERLRETSTGLEVMRSRAEGLKQDQDRISLNVARVDEKVDKFQTDQHDLNLTFTDRTSRMEVQQKMFNEKQGLFNGEIHSRTLAMQDKLGSTASRLEMVHARTDHLQHGQDELGLTLRQTNQRFDQFQSDHLKSYQTIAERTARNEERSLNFMDDQKSLNSKLLNCTDVLTDKYLATEGKLELVNLRANTLQTGQAKIDSDMRLERQINEDRQRELTKYNQMLTERNARVEERQICFISDQKSHNDQMLNRTENFREKLGENVKQIDFVNFRVDNLQVAQQKAEHVQKEKDQQWLETAKKVDVVEHCTEGLRDDQRQMNELLKTLLAQVTDIGARMRTVETRLDTLQADYHRVHEMCIRFDATISGAFGRGPEDARNDLYSSTNENVTSLNKMTLM